MLLGPAADLKLPMSTKVEGGGSICSKPAPGSVSACLADAPPAHSGEKLSSFKDRAGHRMHRAGRLRQALLGCCSASAAPMRGWAVQVTVCISQADTPRAIGCDSREVKCPTMVWLASQCHAQSVRAAGLPDSTAWSLSKVSGRSSHTSAKTTMRSSQCSASHAATAATSSGAGALPPYMSIPCRQPWHVSSGACSTRLGCTCTRGDLHLQS